MTTFLRRPVWVRIVSSLRCGFLSAGLGPRFKAKYGREGVCARFLVKPSMILFDQEAIQHVLKNSPSIYGAPAAKQRGMSHFQPGAVTISHGHEWEERRRFNEAVLYPREAHPLAAAITGMASWRGAGTARCPSPSPATSSPTIRRSTLGRPGVSFVPAP